MEETTKSKTLAQYHKVRNHSFVCGVIFFVRIPTINVKDVRPDFSRATPFSIVNINSFNASLAVELEVVNDNYFNLLFDWIDVKGYNALYDNAKTPVAIGNIGNSTDRLKINHKSVTNFTLPTVLSYDINKDKERSFFNYVLKQCFGGGDKTLTLDLDIDLGFTMIAWTKKAPNVASTVKFKCPF
ncbi:hypothetical protein HDU97_008066 [Phlyctochytrium planicorne]|nr:hypothetical protein HDU97_008066 [Phlyctochytrium planicorne]